MIENSSLAGWYRTHTLGELRASHVSSQVVLVGWVHKRRDHGGLIFLDLRDRYGLTQVVLDPEHSPAAHRLGEELRNEYTVGIKGTVQTRPAGMVNANLPTGEIEVQVSELRIFAKSEILPFPVADESEAGENNRLKYRYLDLRRREVQQNILGKVTFARLMRKYLEEKQFVELETPMLFKSTPEGAREFLVPSRTHPGNFFALPQSPQLAKQLLMVAGFDRYYQVVKCFRDEDLRADRQPEFQQIDCEMSFVDQNFVMQTFEEVTTKAASELLGKKISYPFPRMSYSQAMAEYGVDKPDTRFELKIMDLTKEMGTSSFQVFQQAASSGGIINALIVPDKAESFSRKDLDDLTEFTKNYGGKGLAWVKKKTGPLMESWQSPITKYLAEPALKSIEELYPFRPGDLMLIAAGSFETVKSSLGALRGHLARKLGLIDHSLHHFLWVTEFPLFERDPATHQLAACHHPFTSPLPEDNHLLESAPEKARASAYDLVLNGSEVAGGSIRIHNSQLQALVFKILGLSDEQAQRKFGFLLEALKFGPPPHGGIAFGLDRIVMVLLNLASIRDVIPFPKTHKGACLMTNAPTEVSIEELRDLHIRVQALNK